MFLMPKNWRQDSAGHARPPDRPDRPDRLEPKDPWEAGKIETTDLELASRAPRMHGAVPHSTLAVAGAHVGHFFVFSYQ